jgi:glycosyltransferase involved in cell wall biosynthesis
MKISAIILAKNEEKKIGKTIKSLSFCDEVIVIDDESSDATVQIAQKTGVKVLSHSKKNEFGGQRNWAMEQSENDWILFIDADEEVSEELKKETLSLLTTNHYPLDTSIPVAYAIPRRDFFWDTELKHGETKTARTRGIIRLVKRGSGVWIGAVHERYVSSGKVGKLYGYLNHHSHDSISSFVQDINIYSSIRATELASQGIGTSPIGLIFIPFGKFIYTYFILGGFLDGPAGFVYSFVMSFHSFLVRAKLITKSYV